MTIRKTILFIVLIINTTVIFGFTKEEKYEFWKTPRHGANIFNKEVPNEILFTAKNYGLDFIRIAPDKFITKARDFLIGDADDYSELVDQDLKKLINILDKCYANRLPVVLVFLSLPGSRWNQNNNDIDDLRIWQDEKYLEQAAKFWQSIAKVLKAHPAVVGYNILNEPHPERLYDKQLSNISEIDKESTISLNRFYNKIINKIRVVDPYTPIVVESSAYADPRAFNKLLPIKDNNILYSFHMYEPYTYTNKQLNNGKLIYPGDIPDPDSGILEKWNREKIINFLEPIKTWQRLHDISSDKILVGEFGGHRFSKGLENYFSDLISIFNDNSWHWAFYAFREDTWDGMDYELGSKKLPWEYWKAQESGDKFLMPYVPDNPIFRVLINR